MAERVLVGGFASTEAQVKATALEVSDYYDEDVEGMNFRMARSKDRAYFNDKKVDTHSSGMLAIEGSHPAELTALAPPVPEHQAMLIWRGWVMGRKLRQAEHAHRRIQDTSEYEMLRHFKANFGALPEISQFNAFNAARKLAQHGTKTMVGLMGQDGIFTYDSRDIIASATEAVHAGVEIAVAAGNHVRFTNFPRDVLADIALKQAALPLALQSEHTGLLQLRVA